MTINISPQSTWFIVSQVKSNRVVYFTDDVDYTPPMHGDWYYVSPYRGTLPKGISLRNCWRWRFDGHAFVDASEPATRPPEETLLESNKAALRKLVTEKIDALRRPYAPKSLLGEQVRTIKLAQAQSLLDGTLEYLQESYLVDAAASANCTLQEMAYRVVQLNVEMHEVLRQTERIRVQLLNEITLANTQAALMGLRKRIMTELAPKLNNPIKPEHTTEHQLTAKPSEQQLQQEQVRLSVQLRERINDLRRPYVSQYLLDDVILKHKFKIARQVLGNGGALPAGADAIVLVSHAAARGQTLMAAANEVLAEMNETAQILLATEQLKDAWSVRIAGIETFKEIEDLGQVIGKISLTPSEIPKSSGGER